MILHDFSKENSILNQFIAELRDVNIQKDAMRFRKNIERIGEVLGYELSKTFNYKDKKVETPFGQKTVSMPQNNLVLCSVLRAGLPLHQGLLNYFDKAENAFISAYRHHRDHKDAFKVILKYLSYTSLTNKTIVLKDPMLAKGKTLENFYSSLKKHGIQKQIHIV